MLITGWGYQPERNQAGIESQLIEISKILQ